MKKKNVDIKMKRYMFLKDFREISDHLPETDYLNEQMLRDFLRKFGKVIIKPVRGARGQGVMKVEEMSHNRYKIHHGSTTTILEGYSETWSYIKRKIKDTVYVVQQFIHLASIDDRPFDTRVMVQRIKKGPWEITGKLAKVAGPNFIITNVARSGGKILPFSTALKKSNIDSVNVAKTNSIIEPLALKIAEAFMEIYPYQHIWGMDIGIDVTGKPWLIEANVWPNIYMFKKLKDKSMYAKIETYLSQNKRRI